MALSIQTASIGGAAKNLIVALDPNSNVAVAHVNVNSSGVEIGTAANPIAVTVGNQMAVQPVTAAALPLPTGAATAANQPLVNSDGGGQAHVMNFPGIQVVSAVNLPLPLGAAQDGADASGVAAPAGASGIRGWLSGIYQKLSGTLAVGITTALPTGTNVIGAVTGSGNFAIIGQGAVGIAPIASPIAVSGIDAAGLKQYVRTDTFGVPSDVAWTSGSGSLISLGKALVAAQQATTAAVTSSSIVPPSPAFVQTATFASSLVLKAAAGSLYACYVTTGSTAGWLMLFDAITVPANGTVAPKNCIFCPANATTEIELPFLTVEPFNAGVTAAFSSTGPFTLTASATVFIKGIVQ